MKTFIALILLTISINSHAHWDDWSDSNKGLFLLHESVIILDWITTRYAASNDFYTNGKNRTHETNPILGKHPSTEKVDIYFAVAMVANYFIVDYLPKEYRNFYLIVSSSVQMHYIKNNIQFGWKVSF